MFDGLCIKGLFLEITFKQFIKYLIYTKGIKHTVKALLTG